MLRYVLSVCLNLTRARVYCSRVRSSAGSLVRLRLLSNFNIFTIMTTKKIDRRIKIKFRIRKRISGTAERPRMSVFRSNKQIYVQVIDDMAGRTLVAASSRGMEAMPKCEQAAKVGELIAKKAVEAGISKVVFDRNGYLYHGRVKELADAARKGGLNF